MSALTLEELREPPAIDVLEELMQRPHRLTSTGELRAINPFHPEGATDEPSGHRATPATFSGNGPTGSIGQ